MTVAALKDFEAGGALGPGVERGAGGRARRETEAKIAQLNLAVGHLCSLPDTQIVDMSSFYESEPAYYEDQDAFVNAVVLLPVAFRPKSFWGICTASRTPPAACAILRTARSTLDIDILDYQMYVASDDELTLRTRA